MPDKNWQFELEEYIKQGEPDRAEKSEAWQTAIGLQAVDGLNTSEYFWIRQRTTSRVKSPSTRLRSMFTAITSREQTVPSLRIAPKKPISFLQELQSFWARKRFSSLLPSGLPFTADCLRAYLTTPDKSVSITFPKRNGF